MLAITDSATDAIRGIVSAPEHPDGAGLRISAPPGAEEGMLEVAVAAVPAESDEVVGEEGARVFLEEQAASMLDDKLLDAQVDGQRVGFLIRDQL